VTAFPLSGRWQDWHRPLKPTPRGKAQWTRTKTRRNCGHYVENTGDDTLIMIETFRSDHYEEVSLANWLSHLPPKLVSAHLNIPEETLAMFPRGAQGTVPLP
jgi:oxalate decarboxylase/phosphoglucose isomerase-like protein (cupin superfamily)